MNVTQTIEGRWHINGENEPAHFGKLFYEANGNLCLEVKELLNGSTYDLEISLLTSRLANTSLTIQGYDVHNHPIRLFGCVEDSLNKSIAMRTHRYSISTAVTMLSGGDWQLLAGRSFRVRLSILDCWMNPMGQLPPEDQIRPPIKHTIPNQFGLEVESSISQTFPDGARKETWWLNLSFENQVKVCEVTTKHSSHVCLLLTLLTGGKVVVDEFVFEQNNKKRNALPCELMKSTRGNSGVQRKRHAPFLRTAYEDVADRLPHIVASWFELLANEDMCQVIRLYSALRHHQLFPGVRFLLTAQALEAYHTACRRYSDTKWGKQENDALMKRVRSAINPDDRKRLVDCLAGANSKSFQDKLLEILNDAPSHIQQIIDDPSDFAKQVKDNRNAHTHHVGKRSHSKRVGIHDLITLADKAFVLLEMLLLRDIGAPEKAFNQVVREHKSSVRIKLDHL